MRPLPIRLKLTLWYFAMFAIASLLLSATSWWMLRRTLDATIHQDLQERTDDVRVQLQLLSGKIAKVQTQAAFDAMYRNRDEGKWLQILDQDGHWIYRSPRMLTMNTPVTLPAALPVTGLQVDLPFRGHTVRTFASRFSANGSLYTIETGISLTKSHLLLHDFGFGLLFLTPAVLFAAALAGHILSRKALRPVAAIAYEARRITDRNLDTRLPVSKGKDELSHLSETLNHMLTRIDSSFRSVREFTANASHELRTPLTRLRTDVEITLFRPRPAAEYQHTLERVLHDAVEMSDLIESLLTVARAEAGSEVLRLAPVDLQQVMEEALREWAPLAGTLSIKLEGSSASGKPASGKPAKVVALADPLAIRRLLRIWLDNAFKFTSAGGSIAVSIRDLGEHVVLAVQDSGIGISPEQQKSVFKRFYRVDRASGKEARGSGLGLALAAWIAEQHKSSISIDSALGKGARFAIQLRAVNDDEPRAKSLSPRAHDGSMAMNANGQA